MTNQKSDDLLNRVNVAVAAVNDGVSPTFGAQFSDGVVTRMTCHCAQGNLDVRRGIVISRIAYESRTKGKEPPPTDPAVQALASFCQALLTSNEFLYAD